MKVKVGHIWFEPEVGQPLMVQLTDADKRNLIKMFNEHPHSDGYAVFHKNEQLTREQMMDWVGAKEGGQLN